MTIDALKFFQAYIKEMISLGGENLPKSISAGLGANLAKIYRNKGINNITNGLKESYSVLGAKMNIKKLDTNEFEITINHKNNFCPIGGKYDPENAEFIQKSICIPFTSGFLNSLDPDYKFDGHIENCILTNNESYCRYHLYRKKRDE
ncbi:MAG: hypothetical protein EU542_06300 [Promethearchaeota archaeon]|nr:MAG: hypothetical protein EU542_06300 [Candidatus Lokiarchaeota archaeon]